MSEFAENYFNEEKKVRNSILFNIDFYNDLRKAVDALWNMTIGNTEDENVKIIHLNNKIYTLIKSTILVQTIYIFFDLDKKKISLKTVKNIISSREEDRNYNFLLSINNDIDVNEKVNASEKLNLFSSLLNMDHEKDHEQKVFAKEHLKNSLFNSGNNIGELFDFCQYLSSIMDVKFNIVEVFNKTQKDDIEYAEKLLTGMKYRLDQIMSVSKAKQQLFYNSFVFVKKGYLIFKQDGGWKYLIDMKNKNIDVYYFEGSVDKAISDIQNGTIGIFPYKNMAIKTEENKVLYFSKKEYENLFSIIVNNIYMTMVTDGLIEKEKYTDEIKSYDYQMKYQFLKLKNSEFDTLCTAFLSISSSGFRYDPETKGLVYSENYGYVDNMEEPIEKTKKLNYIKKLSDDSPMYFLNSDWLKGVKYMLTILETENSILPVVHYSESPEKALEESIDYCKKLIAFNEA